LRSEFKGQLPQPFLDHENATSVIQAHFNDINKEEPSRYVSIYFIRRQCYLLVKFCDQFHKYITLSFFSLI